MENKVAINNTGNLYYVDKSGNIYSGDYVLTARVNNSGYARVRIKYLDLGWKEKLVHRLVAESFIKNPRHFKTVNHIDHNKSNNAVSNLEWMSLKKNIKLAWKSGHNTGRPKVSTDPMIIEEMKIDILRGMTRTDVAVKYNIQYKRVKAYLGDYSPLQRLIDKYGKEKIYFVNENYKGKWGDIKRLSIETGIPMYSITKIVKE